MAQKGRKFPPQYKVEAVAFVLVAHRPGLLSIAGDLWIHPGTPGNWVAAWYQGNPELEKAFTPTERAKVAETEDESRKLLLENEFPKKAASFSAKTQPWLSAVRSASQRRLAEKSV